MEEAHVHQRLKNPKSSAPKCQEMIPVIIEPYKKSKLKIIPNNKYHPALEYIRLLYEKDAPAYQVMYKVHRDLDGAKNLFFYALKPNGRYVQLSPGTSCT
jgi:hypothetical protein